MRCGASLIVGRFVLVGACVSSSVAAPSRAQAGQSDVVDAPRVPAAPEVIVRDAAGGATIRAIRLTEPLRVDGTLDEEVYRRELSVDGLVQLDPNNGAPSTERTEAWVMFDADNVYVSARCWESVPPEQWTADEMRRDSNGLTQNDSFGVLFDTFFDRRNGFYFYANPLGGFSDRTVTDEAAADPDWNAVWSVRTGRFAGGWTIEIAVPFKTLRYKAGNPQTWGIQFRRSIRRKNEWTYLTRLPASIRGPSGMTRVSAAGTLVGLEAPAAGRQIAIKPYAISRLTTDRAATRPSSNDLGGDIGLDVKYGVTSSLTADFTSNTDFAQVEVDEQQVNLTRFSLFFPEKRDFFLEARSTFDFGSGAARSPARDADVPALFYSRRIGLNRGRVIPIDAGGRLTGDVGNVRLGVLNIQAGGEAVSGTPSTNFTAVRLKRDILRRSFVGAIFTNRSQSTIAVGANQAFGVDLALGFFENVTMGGYYAATRTPGRRGDDASYQARASYAPDLYGAQIDYLHVGNHFNPEVGFVRRSNVDRTSGLLRYSPRPKRNKWVRRYLFEAQMDYVLNGAAVLETRELTGRFNVEFENSDQIALEGVSHRELLLQPFAVSRGVSVPVGPYGFSDVLATYRFGQQRGVSGNLSFQRGDFYNGRLTALGFTSARITVIPRLSVEPSVSINMVDLPSGEFTTQLLRTRAILSFSPRMFASALVQYGSADNTFSSNLRFRWEYRPGSEFFAVYTDEHDTLAQGLSGLRNRAFVLKVTRLFQY